MGSKFPVTYGDLRFNTSWRTSMDGFRISFGLGSIDWRRETLGSTLPVADCTYSCVLGSIDQRRFVPREILNRKEYFVPTQIEIQLFKESSICRNSPVNNDSARKVKPLSRLCLSAVSCLRTCEPIKLSLVTSYRITPLSSLYPPPTQTLPHHVLFLATIS